MYNPTYTTFSLKDFDTQQLQTTPLSICSYLPDRASQLTYLLLDDSTQIDIDLYTKLSHQGFRRSGEAFYKPNCHHCQQCISARVNVQDFKIGRRFRKVLNRNQYTTLRYIKSCDATTEHFNLYASYINARHADGDMFPPSLHTFERFLMDSVSLTEFIEVREPSGKLIAVAVTDVVADGLSCIYTFYDTSIDYQSRSLGVLCILKQIEIARLTQLPYIYLGYWIPSVKKMRYKTDFEPIELLINAEWHRYDTTPSPTDILNMLDTKPIKTQFN